MLKSEVKFSYVHHFLRLKMTEFTVCMAVVSYLVAEQRFINNDSTNKIKWNPPMYMLVEVSKEKKKEKNRLIYL